MITIFGTVDCEKCNALKTALHALNMPFDFLDADAGENERAADYYEVDELPHVVVTNDFGDCIAEYVGDQCDEFIQSQKSK